MMGMIKRSVGYKALMTVISYLYSALVCSNFEHCSTVRFPFCFNGMQLESIQWVPTRCIRNYPDLKYNGRCGLPFDRI